jgi:uncharacterized protein
VTASIAQIVRALEFTAVRAFLEGLDAQRVVAAAHTATGGRSFPLGDSHVGTLFRILIWLCDWPVSEDTRTPTAPQTHAARMIAKPCAYSAFCRTRKSFLAPAAGQLRVPGANKGDKAMLLPITLTFAAACALLNLWLGIRCARFRIKEKILHGDAGHGLLARRMRAQANFIEYTPIVLILCALIELAIGASLWLWIAALLYVLARVAHAFGMDADNPTLWRGAGALLTWIIMVALAIMALMTAYHATRALPAPPALAAQV